MHILLVGVGGVGSAAAAIASHPRVDQGLFAVLGSSIHDDSSLIDAEVLDRREDWSTGCATALCTGRT
jgi:hypothetical protein